MNVYESHHPGDDLGELIASSFDQHAHAGRMTRGEAVGSLDGVFDRVSQRRARTRNMALVGSFAVIAIGVAGIIAIRGDGEDDLAGSSVSTNPIGQVAASGGFGWECQGPLNGPDGTTVFDGCQIAPSVGDPVWRCVDPVAVLNQDGVEVFKSSSCSVAGEFGDLSGVELTATTVAMPGIDVDCVAEPLLPTATTAVPIVVGGESVPTIATTIDNLPDSSLGSAPPIATTPPHCVELVPSSTQPGVMQHVVRDGENLSGIAEMYGTTLELLVAFNEIPGYPSTFLLIPGQTIILIPPGGTEVSASSGGSGAANVIALGDSVMAGVADELAARGYLVSAQVASQSGDLVETLATMEADGLLDRTKAVAIHIGTNGPIDPADLDTILDIVHAIPNVLLFTVHANRSWVQGNNDLIRSIDQPGDNVVVIDWDTLATECGTDCLFDGIHLTENGATYYADLMSDWTGL